MKQETYIEKTRLENTVVRPGHRSIVITTQDKPDFQQLQQALPADQSAQAEVSWQNGAIVIKLLDPPPPAAVEPYDRHLAEVTKLSPPDLETRAAEIGLTFKKNDTRDTKNKRLATALAKAEEVAAPTDAPPPPPAAE